MAHIVPVPHKCKTLAFEGAQSFFDGQKISHCLARMFKIGQGVDDRHACVAGELAQPVVAERANDDSTHPALKIFCNIVDGFALPEADIRLRQKNRVRAKLLDGNVERDVRSQRLLLKNHCERLTVEDVVKGPGIPFHPLRQFEDLQEIPC